MIETKFEARRKPWEGLGQAVGGAVSSKEALERAGLDWKVLQEPLFTSSGFEAKGFKANVRDKDKQLLGVVTDRYKIIQNEDAFAFTDELLKQGVRYETAGSIQGGRKVWLLARLPQEYIIGGERISPYLVFFNSHDGTAAVKVAITPIRVACCNTLNLALSSAERTWSMNHTGDIMSKIDEARDTLFHAEKYMDELGKEFESLKMKSISDEEVMEYVELLIPMDDTMTSHQRKNIRRLRDDMKSRYFDAPDLQNVGRNAYRFLNAVSDFATHSSPLRKTVNFRENLFARTVEGNPLIDKAYQLVCAG